MKTFMKLGVELPMGETILLGGRESIPRQGIPLLWISSALQPQ